MAEIDTQKTIQGFWSFSIMAHRCKSQINQVNQILSKNISDKGGENTFVSLYMLQHPSSFTW